MYYISRVLQNAEIRYSLLEKLIFVLIVFARKLRPYFQAHIVVILTNQPLKATHSKPDIAGRMAKWALELTEFDLCSNLDLPSRLKS